MIWPEYNIYYKKWGNLSLFEVLFSYLWQSNCFICFSAAYINSTDPRFRMSRLLKSSIAFLKVSRFFSAVSSKNSRETSSLSFFCFSANFAANGHWKKFVCELWILWMKLGLSPISVNYCLCLDAPLWIWGKPNMKIPYS